MGPGSVPVPSWLWGEEQRGGGAAVTPMFPTWGSVLDVGVTSTLAPYLSPCGAGVGPGASLPQGEEQRGGGAAVTPMFPTWGSGLDVGVGVTSTLAPYLSPCGARVGPSTLHVSR